MCVCVCGGGGLVLLGIFYVRTVPKKMGGQMLVGEV